MLASVERKIAIVLLLISILYLFLSFQLPAFPYAIVDADALPKGLGILLAALSILLFILNPTEDRKKSDIKKDEVLMLVAVASLIFVYILLFELLGFVIVTILFLLVTSRMLGYTKWKTLIAVSIGFTLILYFSFNYLLQIYLPQGLLPF
ncbi:tripartite tricarboxylate transporter TctB family protein [Guptibacillus hwajinpoensis]|uniref:tripartite tricarboxylate transporter TctB family protein n=1 Tax=Guptibacillus hwajinpoensis TaxID=208199 RepID=UPI001CFDF395|nr:tripartite tricarboxylate transporter TctB family protein [Pseudalkalibacillus hwajinpoensis]WLR61410.1 tripartite tricarboxylate transporter TctB family protein [Pseudalkalibacillus hwajinpoensis]